MELKFYNGTVKRTILADDINYILRKYYRCLEFIWKKAELHNT